MQSYRDRVVVITGAGSGMGRAYAIEAASRGARLALNDVSEAGLSETISQLPPGTRVHSEAFDVADRDAVYAFADAVAAELGGADVVINNAGIEGATEPVWALSDAAIEQVMAINFWGVVHGTRAFLPQLLAGESGAVVNVSSLFGLVGAPHAGAYCAAKFAVRGFTEALAAELLGTGVSVHTVHPGGIDTNISNNAAFHDRYLKTPPETVARAVLDAVGTRRTRIVIGHQSATTWLGARLLPQWLMTRLIARDVAPTLDRTHYPPAEHLDALRGTDARASREALRGTDAPATREALR